MKCSSLFFKILTIGAFIYLGISCNHNRNVVPYEVDADEIYKELEANEDSSVSNPAFGQQNIAGFSFDSDFTTDDENIFIYFPKFTVLDVNPKINQSLFDFVQEQLSEFGFVNPEDSLPAIKYTELISEGIPFRSATDSILGEVKKEFEARISEIKSYGTPFNINFQIYPVYLDDNFVTYRKSAYSYTGGAHGMTINYLQTYNLESGELLTLDDIIKTGEEEQIREEVAAQMAYSYPIYENITTVNQYIDSLNVWLDYPEVSPSDNKITVKNFPLSDPALTTRGLAFVYQMYELTPGSDGCPLVVVPYNDIKRCLNDNFKALAR